MPALPQDLTTPHALCFLAILAGVLAVSFLWSVSVDLGRIADVLERREKERRP